MKKIAFFTLLIFALSSCKDNSNKAENATQNLDGLESFVVLETMDAAPYIYILGDQEGVKRWFAISAREVVLDEKYFYDNPLVMTDFYSKELDRPFDEVVFLSRVSKDPNELKRPTTRVANKPSGKVTTDQLELNIEIPENALSISQLFEQLDQYNGKNVKVRGQVVKFSPQIMNTNWIHIQDGTAFDGKYDLTITSSEVVQIGDILTFEGTVAVNKDFGYGYFYELIIEKAKTIK